MGLMSKPGLTDKALTVICDAEFDSLTPTRLWCVVCKELETGEVHVFRFDKDRNFREFSSYADKVTSWVGHNFLLFDAPNFHNLGILELNPSYPGIVDTLVISRLIEYKRAGGHSIENLGKPYGIKKKQIVEYDNPDLIDEYVERCISDVEINYLIYTKEFQRFVEDPEWQRAIKLEHEFALTCKEITTNGFSFNVDGANTLLCHLQRELSNLTEDIRKTVPDIKELTKTITLRRKKDGTPDSRTEGLFRDGVVPLSGYSSFVDGTTCDIWSSRPFNPASPKDRINLLNEAGWKPTVKTKTHMKADQQYRHKGKSLKPEEKERWDRLKLNGWQVCEENLKTLPKDAPEGARKLAEWLTLSARESDLTEWLGHSVKDSDGVYRIHSNVMSIGSWTHRCSHSNPNCANIFSVYNGEADNPVDMIKDKYDAVLRSFWTASPGKWLVGCDADGIQLRVLAHLMEDEEYIEAVCNGRKEDGTDVHNVNRRALQLEHINRDDSKTFIYAWLLGAATPKVSSILKCSFGEAKRGTELFITRFPGLYDLKRKRIPSEARRGYFVGVDGRKVLCSSEHLMLAGHLQNAERIIMATANGIWKRNLTKLEIPFRQVNLVHDEFQTEGDTEEEAHIIGRVQSEAIKEAGELLHLKCPMSGSYKVGKDWRMTH